MDLEQNQTIAVRQETLRRRRNDYFSLRAFLQTWKLSPVEAQILYEVCNYPEHHVDVKTLRKKLPPKFKGADIENCTNSLMNRPIPLLQSYIRKPELCVLCTSNGRHVVDEMESRSYVDMLTSYDQMEIEFAKIVANVCEDSWGLTKSNERACNGVRGKAVVEYEIMPSVVPYRDDQNCWHVTAKLKCPQCSREIAFQYAINPENGTQYVRTPCTNCGLSLNVQRALYQYYTD